MPSNNLLFWAWMGPLTALVILWLLWQMVPKGDYLHRLFCRMCRRLPPPLKTGADYWLDRERR